MDARMDIAVLLGFAEGDAHVFRNAGGIVTDDAIRSLTVSQRLAGTREVMLIHHTDCAMQRPEAGELRKRVAEEAGVVPPFSMEAFSELDVSVRDSIARIKDSQFLAHTDQVRGFVCDLETGALREVR